MSKPLKKRVRERPRRSVRGYTLGEGMGAVAKLRAELQDYTDVLMGRAEPPIESGTMTLMECADGYYARAAEITMNIQRQEADGQIVRGHPLVKFRTGELRTFMEMAKSAAALGSRRITAEQLHWDKVRTGRESR